MTKTTKKIYNKVSTILGKIIDCGVKIEILSHPDHPRCEFIKGDFGDLLTIKKQMEIHFPICKICFVSQTYSDVFSVFWNDFNKNEGVLKITFPNMDSKEVIEECFNK